MSKQQELVQTYYDATTNWFMRFGSTRKHGSIHRALYDDAIHVDDPTHVIHHHIKHSIDAFLPDAEALLDLGCGVGASLQALHQLVPSLIQLHGVTISQVQAAYAQRTAHHVLLASYHDLPYGDASMDVVIAIESMIHSDNPQKFWREGYRVLRPGGIMIVCDDVVCDAQHPMLEVFRRGWQAPNLQTHAFHVDMAMRHGFVLRQSRDLTRNLRVVPFPQTLLNAFGQIYPFVESIPLLTSTIGSIALQNLLHDAAVAYTYMVYERP